MFRIAPYIIILVLSFMSIACMHYTRSEAQQGVSESRKVELCTNAVCIYVTDKLIPDLCMAVPKPASFPFAFRPQESRISSVTCRLLEEWIITYVLLNTRVDQSLYHVTWVLPTLIGRYSGYNTNRLYADTLSQSRETCTPYRCYQQHNTTGFN